ncbi:MAG: undecaprenyl-diphosphate phosphatase [Ruminococcaceae bacterium]|nr:undecaprenyl-diphosphate phosphatase [Oscillospiraceae bacterium]
MLELLKVIFIGIVQGITEWLPVSSTGHMILTDTFIKLNVSKEFWDMFLVVIQFGSILAVLLLYFHKLNPFSPKKTKEERKDTLNLWGKVIVGVLPAAVIGLLLDDWLSETVFVGDVATIVIAVALIFYGILFIWMENRNKNRVPKVQELGDLTYKTAFLIGCFQLLSLIPGTSRSGSTILGAVLIGTSRYVAAEYSFFLAIPVMCGASLLKSVKFFLKTSLTAPELVILGTGVLVAFLVSVFAIKFLMGYIKKHDFKAFGYYRIVLGLLVALYFIIW